jgi:hypothetical protein
MSSLMAFSADRRHRFFLPPRDVAPLTGKGTCVFVMFNSSTADERKNDPTITRCIDFVAGWGYRWFTCGNLFSLISPDPRDVHQDPNAATCAENNRALERLMLNCELLVYGWGGLADAHMQRVREVEAMRPQRIVPHCLGVTKSGMPKHPLYLGKKTELIPWRMP